MIAPVPPTHPKLVLALLPLLMVAGCAATPHDATYAVTVRNEAQVPVVLWLTKDGPPVEADWLSAAQWQLLADPDSAGVLPALTLNPNDLATLGPRAGRFGGSTRAVLDVYATPATPQGMADAKPGDADLARVDLKPGDNYVRVVGVALPAADGTSSAGTETTNGSGVTATNGSAVAAPAPVGAESGRATADACRLRATRSSWRALRTPARRRIERTVSEGCAPTPSQ